MKNKVMKNNKNRLQYYTYIQKKNYKIIFNHFKVKIIKDQLTKSLLAIYILIIKLIIGANSVYVFLNKINFV